MELSMLCGQEIGLIIFDQVYSNLLVYKSSEDFNPAKIEKYIAKCDPKNAKTAVYTNKDFNRLMSIKKLISTDKHRFKEGKAIESSDDSQSGQESDSASNNSKSDVQIENTPENSKQSTKRQGLASAENKTKSRSAKKPLIMKNGKKGESYMDLSPTSHDQKLRFK